MLICSSVFVFVISSLTGNVSNHLEQLTSPKIIYSLSKDVSIKTPYPGNLTGGVVQKGSSFKVMPGAENSRTPKAYDWALRKAKTNLLPSRSMDKFSRKRGKLASIMPTTITIIPNTTTTSSNVNPPVLS